LLLCEKALPHTWHLWGFSPATESRWKRFRENCPPGRINSSLMLEAATRKMQSVGKLFISLRRSCLTVISVSIVVIGRFPYLRINNKTHRFYVARYNQSPEYVSINIYTQRVCWTLYKHSFILIVRSPARSHRNIQRFGKRDKFERGIGKLG
jgi:hypothetical protein